MIHHAAAKLALMACRRTLERDFPNSATVLAAYIDEQNDAQYSAEEVPAAKDPLVAARERLGAWIVAHPGWVHDVTENPHSKALAPFVVELFTLDWYTSDRDVPDPEYIEGGGPDLASAIVAALEKANT